MNKLSCQISDEIGPADLVMGTSSMAEIGIAPPIGSGSQHDNPSRNFVRFTGPWVRAARLAAIFCSWDLAYRCTRGGWLKPILQGRRRSIYRLADVLACLRRIEAGEVP